MDLDEFESRMSRIDTLDRGDLASLALEFLHHRHIRQVAYHHLPPLGAPDARTARVLSDGFSPEIMEMYAVGRSKGTTPVLNYVQQNPDPVYLGRDREPARPDALREGLRGDPARSGRGLRTVDAGLRSAWTQRDLLARARART